MKLSLLAAPCLCASLIAQNASAQAAPSIGVEVIGDGITVDIEVEQDSSSQPAQKSDPPGRRQQDGHPADGAPIVSFVTH